MTKHESYGFGSWSSQTIKKEQTETEQNPNCGDDSEALEPQELLIFQSVFEKTYIHSYSLTTVEC